MIGEQFLVGEEICGAVCSIRNQEDILSLWNRTADNPLIINRIRDTMRRVLNLPVNAILEYKKHDDCLKWVFKFCCIVFKLISIFFRDQSSYRHTNPDVNRR